MKQVTCWERFKQYYLPINEIGFALDISKMNFDERFLEEMEPKMHEAFESMRQLEKGGIANPDEQRQVGHYWLRDASLAPTQVIKSAIEECLDRIHSFVSKVHSTTTVGEKGAFNNFIIIGIGGSILGPQFVSKALGVSEENSLTPYFIDNTDPDGLDLVFFKLEGQLGETLVLVISKSGGTLETRNAMLEVKAVYEKEGLDFSKHAVAITQQGSKLDDYAIEEKWLDRFPMWDWVGGRTSEFSVVGLLPAALEGIDIKPFLKGAAMMDAFTRITETRKNPAALLAIMWYHATDGKGKKDMVMLPYKDRLSLLSRYLQQLIMESLGKEKNLSGQVVSQGITVYGNKGSTDQHAYLQQLREGVHNFFVTFVEVLKDRQKPSIDLEEGNTAGDYLNGFLLGTRAALYEKNRESITITLEEVTPSSVGALIALYERAVGIYATLIGINAYHQPGVEAGKKAAASFLSLKSKIWDILKAHPNQPLTVDTITKLLDVEEDADVIFKLLQHLAANPQKNIYKQDNTPFDQSFYVYKT